MHESPNQAEIVGYPTGTLLGQNALALVHVDDQAKIKSIFDQVLSQSGASRKTEARVRARNGAWLWLETVLTNLLHDSAVGGIVLNSRDITAWKKADKELRESEQRFRQVTESLPQIVWSCNSEGACDYLGPQWTAFTGVPAVRHLAFGWLDQVHPDDRQRTIDHWKAAIRGEKLDLEFRLRRHDGVYRWFRTLAVPLRNETGDIVKWFGADTDVTDMKQAQMVLAQSKADLEALVVQRTAKLQELLGELQHFSYSITHDMRAPLRAMRGFAEQIHELCAHCPDSQQKIFLDRIIVASERMDNLIRDALNYGAAIGQEFQLRPVNLDKLLVGMLDSYPEFFGNRANIRVEEGIPLVLGNEAGLTQCF